MIKNIEDYIEFAKTAKKYQRFEFICTKCGKITSKQFIRSRKFNCMCRKCSFENTSFKKFGTLCPLQNEEIKEKIKKTVKEKYGVDCILKSKEVQEQIKNTNREKYGAENVFASEEIKSRIKETMMERYGVEHALQYEEFLEKCNKTKLERFGTLAISALPEIKEKLRRAHLKKYGVVHSSKSDVVKAKIAKTNLERYGYTAAAKNETVRKKLSKAMKAHFSNKERRKQIMEKREKTSIQRYGYSAAIKSIEARKRISNIMTAHFSDPKRKKEILEKREKTNLKRYGTKAAISSPYIKNKNLNAKLAKYGTLAISNSYKFDDYKFDSSWELAFYCYNLYLDKPIKKCTKFFDYKYNGIPHKYFPDFEIDGRIFEIKGDHFFNEEGLMICPFDRAKDGLFQTKQQCGIKNNVIFITRKEITPALNYMENTYGKNWKEIFKIKKAK